MRWGRRAEARLRRGVGAACAPRRGPPASPSPLTGYIAVNTTFMMFGETVLIS